MVYPAGNLWTLNTKVEPFFFFIFTLVTGPRRSLSLELSDTRVEPSGFHPKLSPIPNFDLYTKPQGRGSITNDAASAAVWPAIVVKMGVGAIPSLTSMA